MKEINLTINIKEYSISELSSIQQNLIKKAKEIAKTAYAPYSKFRVGSAILLENGKIITGNNQENIAYPSGLCAERVAMFYANAQYPNVPVQMIAITSYFKNDFLIIPSSPCGACRQVLLETEMRFQKDILVILAGKNKVQIIKNVKDLLPLFFENLDLKNE